MKVAILNNLFPPDSHGGAEEAAEIQANTFFTQGNEVVVLTLSPTNKFSVQARGGIKIYKLRHRNIFNYFDIGKYNAPARFLWHIVDTFNFCLAGDIKKILKAEKIDLAVCHNLKGIAYLTPRAINSSGIKQWQVMHDVQLYTPSGLIEYGKENIFEHTGFFTRGYRFFTRRLFKYAEKVFFPSAWLLNFYRKNDFFVHPHTNNGVKKIILSFVRKLFPNNKWLAKYNFIGVGVNQEKIYQPNKVAFETRPPQCPPQSGEPESLIMEVGSPQVQKSGFLYVGQLEAHKGILFLLDVFEKIDAKLDIVGDGSLMPEIKKRALNNPNIIIHGRVAREKLPEFYSRAKATIFPSLVYENAPMVIAESLSCGTPAIVSRLGGAPELIREGENGATFTPGDAKDLAEKIKKFLS